MILVTRVDAIGQWADQKGKVGEVGVVKYSDLDEASFGKGV